MKALLICPADHAEVVALTEATPLSNLSVFGKSLVEHWLLHLLTRGATKVWLLTSDRPEQLRSLVGDGARWGLRTIVCPEVRELTPAEARAKYRDDDDTGWLPAPFDITVMNHLPGLPQFPLVASYADCFSAWQAWLPQALTPDRIGVREIKPNVWVGLRAQVSPEANLCAPCWIGDRAFIGPGTIIGPMAVVENDSFIERGAQVSNSVISPETFVGEFVEVRNSIALGGTLVNWKRSSCVKVSDTFLLGSLARRTRTFNPAVMLGRLAAAFVLLLTLPVVLIWMLMARMRGLSVLRPRIAVRPRANTTAPMPGDTLLYHELPNVHGWLRRWPQLWKIVRGEFVWIGNRPLSHSRAARLTNEFERLWLATPIGLISLADAEACSDLCNDETRAHASYYAAQANWRLDISIFTRSLYLLFTGVSYSQTREQFGRSVEAMKPGAREAH